MDIEARDKLVEAIGELTRFKEEQEDPSKIYIKTLTGREMVALRQLQRDLKASDKPINVTYADIAAIEASLLPYLSVVSGSANSVRSNVFQIDCGVLTALNNALEKGVLITQDRARGRIGGI